jgi:hypothetical protein
MEQRRAAGRHELKLALLGYAPQTSVACAPPTSLCSPLRWALTRRAMLLATTAIGSTRTQRGRLTYLRIPQQYLGSCAVTPQRVSRAPAPITTRSDGFVGAHEFARCKALRWGVGVGVRADASHHHKSLRPAASRRIARTSHHCIAPTGIAHTMRITLARSFGSSQAEASPPPYENQPCPQATRVF